MNLDKIYKVSAVLGISLSLLVVINFYCFYKTNKYFLVPFFVGNSGEQVEIKAVAGLEVEKESISLSDISEGAYSGFFENIKNGAVENILIDDVYKNRINRNLQELKKLWKSRTLSVIEYSFVLGGHEYVLLSYVSNNEKRIGYYRFKIINDDYFYSPFGDGDLVEKLLRELTMTDVLDSLSYGDYIKNVLFKNTSFSISNGANIYLDTGLGFKNNNTEVAYSNFLEALNEKDQNKFKGVFTKQEFKRSYWMFDEKYKSDYSAFKSSFSIAKVKGYADLGRIHVLYLEVEDTPLWQPLFLRKDEDEVYRIFGIGRYSDSLDRFRNKNLIKEIM